MNSQQGGSGAKTSRRTLVKGAAWSVPVVAVAAPARAVGSSVGLTSSSKGQRRSAEPEEVAPGLASCLSFAATPDSCLSLADRTLALGLVVTNTCAESAVEPGSDVTLEVLGESVWFQMPAHGQATVVPTRDYPAGRSGQVTLRHQGQVVGTVEVKNECVAEAAEEETTPVEEPEPTEAQTEETPTVETPVDESSSVGTLEESGGSTPPVEEPPATEVSPAEAPPAAQDQSTESAGASEADDS